MPNELMESLSRRGLDTIEQEEMADLLCNRYFHASILCRDDAPREFLSHQDIFEQVYLATSLSSSSDPFDLAEGIVETFIGNHRQEVILDSAITKAAVVLLAAQWPAGMKLENLYQKASALLARHRCDVTSTARSQLTEELATLFEAGVVDLRLKEPSFNTVAPEYPKIHALARYEMECRDALTTPYHLTLALNSQMLEITAATDGSKSVKQLKKLYGEEIVCQTISILSRWGLLEEQNPVWI